MEEKTDKNTVGQNARRSFYIFFWYKAWNYAPDRAFGHTDRPRHILLRAVIWAVLPSAKGIYQCKYQKLAAREVELVIHKAIYTVADILFLCAFHSVTLQNFLYATILTHNFTKISIGRLQKMRWNTVFFCAFCLFSKNAISLSRALLVCMNVCMYVYLLSIYYRCLFWAVS